MTKDRMKGKISMALKDPVLQQGFEVICSKLSRLEKENAELEAKISVLLFCRNCPENKGGLLCEKEYEGRCLSQKIMYIKELKAEMKEQLAKVKELLTKWVELFKPKGGNIPPTPIQVETEQFLRELEE